MLRLIILLLVAVQSLASVRDTLKEHEMELQLGKVSPESVEIFKQATAALDQRDYAKASELYAQVLAKAPDFDPALRRMGSALIELGQRERDWASFQSR